MPHYGSRPLAGTLALASLLVCAAPGAAQQAAYPSRPVRIVVGFTSASSNDILARYVGMKLGERLGQQIVVENRPGANGTIGAEVTVKANPDGHTLMLVSTSYPMSAAVNKLSFDPLKSVSAVAMLGAGALVLVPGRTSRAIVEGWA